MKTPQASTILKRVAIVGGTHGNERAGVHLVKLFRKNPDLIKRPSFETMCLIANEAAVVQNRRYVENDLNRCFDQSYLEKARSMGDCDNEMRRCVEIDDMIGPKFGGLPKVDLVLDLHNTNSNTGVLLCFHKEDTFAKQIAGYLSQHDKNIASVLWPQDDPPFLPTIGRSGMTIEIGPVSQGIVNAGLFEKTKEIIQRILDFVELHNTLAKDPSNTSISRVETSIALAERVAEIGYPRDDDGDIVAFVHPDLQGIPELNTDHVVKQGSPLFLSTLGETIPLDLVSLKTNNPKIDPHASYSLMFVNESAYYEKNLAMVLTKVYESPVYTFKV